MKSNRYIYIIVLLCMSFQLKAQQVDKISANPVFTADYIVGTFQHKEGERERITSHFVSLSAMLKTGLNENSFFVDYGKPHIGVSALGGVFSNRDVYGSVWSLYPTWQFEFFPDKQVGWNIKLGTGLAYFTRPFDKFDNTTNFLIGSKINNITEIAANAWIALAPQLQLQTGVSFYHFSNAHVRIPNLGLNQAAVRMGLIYKPDEFSKFSAKPRIIQEPDSMLHRQLELSFGRHELAYSTLPVDGPSYSIFKLGYYATKRLQRIHEVKIGLAAAFYNSYFTQMRFEQAEGVKFLQATQTRLVAGHEFLMRRFGFVSDIGIIITDPFYRQEILNKTSFGDQWFRSYLSARLGLKCYVVGNSFSAQKIALGMFLNTHGTIADYLEFSASFGW
ncbi:MAG: acyloxyacyl hydrolase [Bacteroidetes bacterium]|nr:acyloxyacyl hydrolase [Bacteroidota bacterium]